jgi:antitoxin component YwqK of YwqJK toxin-antitoxin module
MLARLFMTKMILFPIAIASVFCSFAQQKDTIRKYLDNELRFTNRNKSVFPALAIRQEDHWMLVAVYPDTGILLKIYFKDAGLTIKHGPYSLYHPGKIKAREGFFNENVPSGCWQSWYKNGQLKDSGILVANQFAGIWKHWYENGRLQSWQEYADVATDSVIKLNGTPPDLKGSILFNAILKGILNGSSKSWYVNGQLESMGQYQRDTLSGLWTWYRENGFLSTRETYSKGKIIALECFNEKGEPSGSTCSILKPPAFIHPFLEAQDYIVNELHRRKNKDIYGEGVAELSFTIDKTGKMVNLLIKNSPDSALNKHIYAVVDKMPGWSPAITHNRTIDFPMQLSIPFFRNPDE